MAITKKFKVSFDVTAVVDSETEKSIADGVLKLARRVHNNDPKVHPVEREMLVQALTGGVDALVAFVIRKSIRDTLLEELGNDETLKPSPATVRVIK